MAKVRLVAPVGAISGKFGGAMFVSRKSGTTLQLLPKQKTSTSTAQLTTRNLLSYLSRRYRDLTADQKASWKVSGSYLVGSNSLGEPHPLSGLAAYQAYNGFAFRAGETSDSPPTFAARSRLYSYDTLVWNQDGDFPLEITEAPPSPNLEEQLYLSRFLPDNQRTRPRRSTYAFTIYRTNTTENLASLFTSIAVDLEEGENVAARLVQKAPGYYPSIAQTLFTTILAPTP